LGVTPPGAVGRGIDRFLDRSVVLGFTRIGPALRRTWWPEDLRPGALAGSVVAVTGANSGLGKATALGAARLGAEVRMLCRSIERGAEAREEILREVPAAKVHVDRCDVSDLASLPQVAADLRQQAPRLRALVHNAGVLPHDRVETADGHELTFATHVLGPHVLTDALREPLAADGQGRVLFVVSGGMYTQPLHVEDPEYASGTFSGTVAYARTKRMQVHLAERWAEELADVGVTVHSVHPGWADTPGVNVSLPAFRRLTRPLLRSADEGADTTVWLLGAREAAESTGRFWHDRALRSTSYLSRTEPTPDQVRRLWDLVVAATGVPARSA
jgi:NAD(P)-dependent dehydrogenase (short-subunit alcohol dehydrogenase family)